METTFQRFSDRVKDYVKYRPHYPPSVIDILKEKTNFNKNSIVADVGCGTGIFSELFVDNGNEVYGVEPNEAMLEAAKEGFKATNFKGILAPAEATSLTDHSVDYVMAAQAFHWFDLEKTKQEFKRILKPNGWVCLIWNVRDAEHSKFLQDYEAILRQFAPNYEQGSHQKITDEIIDDFFAPNNVMIEELYSFQEFDFVGLKGRALSNSYAPKPEDSKYTLFISALETLFDKHQVNDKIRFDYKVKVYLAQM